MRKSKRRNTAPNSFQDIPENELWSDGSTNSDESFQAISTDSDDDNDQSDEDETSEEENSERVQQAFIDEENNAFGDSILKSNALLDETGLDNINIEEATGISIYHFVLLNRVKE